MVVGKILSLTLAAFLFLAMRTEGQTPSPSEYEIKAAFLFNFAKFIEWPIDRMPSSEGEQGAIVVGVLGNDPFGPDLDKIIRGKKVRDKDLIIKRFTNYQLVEKCHILFISKSEQKNLSEILQRLKNTNILTVSEVDEFTEMGGIINFTLEQSRIRFQINLGAAEREGLRISSQLLKLAYIVKEETKH